MEDKDRLGTKLHQKEQAEKAAILPNATVS